MVGSLIAPYLQPALVDSDDSTSMYPEGTPQRVWCQQVVAAAANWSPAEILGLAEQASTASSTDDGTLLENEVETYLMEPVNSVVSILSYWQVSSIVQ